MDRPQILVIDSYHGEYFWTQEYRAGIKRALVNCCEISYFEMDTKRIPSSQFTKKADEAFAFYQQMKPEGVILADDNAVRLLGQRIAEEGVPLTYLGVNKNPRQYLKGRLNNVTGVLGRTPYRRSVSMIWRYLQKPDAKVLVLFDNSPTAHAMFEGGFGGHKKQSIAGVEAEIRLLSTEEEWKISVLNAQKNGFDAIDLILYHNLKNEDGQVVNSEKVLAWTAQNTPVPPFGMWEFSLANGEGVIGGLVAAGYPQGLEAGLLLKQMVLEKKFSLPPKASIEGGLMFSRSQIRKWNLVIPGNLAEKARFVP